MEFAIRTLSSLFEGANFGKWAQYVRFGGQKHQIGNFKRVVRTTVKTWSIPGGVCWKQSGVYLLECLKIWSKWGSKWRRMAFLKVSGVPIFRLSKSILWVTNVPLV